MNWEIGQQYLSCLTKQTFSISNILNRAVELNTHLLYFIKFYELNYYLFSLIVILIYTCIFMSKYIKVLHLSYRV